MVKSAVQDYKYQDDDILNDTISSFTVFATSLGGILGPFYAGIVSDYYGIKNCLLIVSAVSFGFLFVFAHATDFISDMLKNKANKNSSELAKSLIT